MAEIIRLSNGLRIVYEKIPFVRSISFGIWVGNGSRNENPENSGISHFVEHMMFKGTKTRTAKQIADEMDAVGGQINAYTSKEYTCYYTMTLDTHFDIALDVLSDMFFNSKFSDSEIKKERTVILEEISMYEDSPEELVYDLLQENVWQKNSLSSPILGTQESISTFTQKKIKKYVSENYQPQNSVIAIAGNIDTDEAIKKIENYFGDWQNSSELMSLDDSPVFHSGIYTKSKDIEQIHLCLGFPGLQVGSEDAYALAIFNSIFGGGMSSRLFQTIREDKGLAYSVYSFTSNYRDTGIFSIYAGMGVPQTADVLKLILKEISKLKRSKITDLSLSRTKEQLKSNLIIGQESTLNRMTNIGRSTLLLNRIQSLDELILKIDRVELSDLESLQKRIFGTGLMGLSAVGKVQEIDFESLL